MPSSKKASLKSKRSASKSKYGGAVRSSRAVASSTKKYDDILKSLSERSSAKRSGGSKHNKKTCKSKMHKHSGGSSDWMGTLYSAGPINSPPQSEQEFRAFNTTYPYSDYSKTLTSPDIDVALCGKPVTGYSPHDPYADVSAMIGGRKKSTKRSVKRSGGAKKRSVKRSTKRSAKRSAKKRSVKRSAKRSTKRSAKRSGGAKKRSVKRSTKRSAKRSTKRSTKRTAKRSAKKRSSRKHGGMFGTLLEAAMPTGFESAATAYGLAAVKGLTGGKKHKHSAKKSAKRSPKRSATKRSAKK